jgi:hypothetical protein
MDTLLFTVTREPTNSASTFTRTEFNGGFRALREKADWPACIKFGLSTDRPSVRNSSQFTGYITTDKFSHLAKLMFEADPEAAIRAFGAAMQEADIQRRPEQANSDAA